MLRKIMNKVASSGSSGSGHSRSGGGHSAGHGGKQGSGPGGVGGKVGKAVNRFLSKR